MRTERLSSRCSEKLTMTTLERVSRTGSRTVTRSTGTRIIAVANQKGGVGKTDLTVNISCQLAAAGKKVLLIDMDPQANATDYLVKPDTPVGKTMADLLLDDDVSLEDVVIYGCRENLDVAPAHGYDFVVIDTPPSLGILTVNTLTAATEVLIPVQAQYFAMDGVVQLMDT